MLPGIFNHVIGPVMRGPSSSHTAATWRIARVCLDILNEPLKKAIIEFDQEGVWANNYKEQGTVMGINGGLLGLEITDPQMMNLDSLIEERALEVVYQIRSFHSQHVNTVRLYLEGVNGNKIKVVAASLGGGLFNIDQFNGFNINMDGASYELLILGRKIQNISVEIEKILPAKVGVFYAVNDQNEGLVNVKSPQEIPNDIINQLKSLPHIDEVIFIHPILPIVSGNEKPAPFNNIETLLNYAQKEKLSLGDLGIVYEKCLSGLEEDVLRHKMSDIITIIENSIQTGLEGTSYHDRILPPQSHLIKEAEKKGKILQNSITNTIISNVTAIMEVKSAMGVFVANPTAGSCGTVGGLVQAIAEELKSTKDELIDAYFAAGIMGAYFAAGPGFSAEEHGCQVECGAASGMAAAAIVQLFGGSAQQALDAASMAIQNMIGLICDPVADRVEVPCLGKNINAAVNAHAAAIMVCSGFNALIPLTEVIQTVSQVSRHMPSCVKCTGKGGLSLTKTAQDLKNKLREAGNEN